MFRKAALAKLASPEQLDSLMQVTTTKGWIALIGVFAVIGAGLVWGVLGRTSSRVSGAGILLKQGGIFAVESRGMGILRELLVDVNDDVTPGQILARVSQLDVAESIKQTESLLKELRANRNRSIELVNRNTEADLRSLKEDANRLDKETGALTNQIEFLESRLKAQTEALQLGLITRDQQQATGQQLEATRSLLIANQAQRAQLEARDALIRNQAEQSIFTLDQEIRRNERLQELTLLKHKDDTEIKSPYAGKVVGLLVDEGQEVRPGMSILFVEPVDFPLQAIAFIPLQGARIKPGMVAQMSPEGLTWEEYGYLLGEVVSVLQTPVSPDAMNRILRNPQLVQQFTAAGSVYEVRVRPQLSRDTVSGFKWTTRQGPPVALGSGTLLRVQIAVEEKRPIEMVIPTARRWLGI